MTDDIYTKREISHEEAIEVARRLVNSHFKREPHARVSIPARPDYDDDLLISAYINQQNRREEEANAKLAVAGDLLQRFLACPEIADCAPEDKDGGTHSLESEAPKPSQPSPPRRRS